MYMQRYSEIAGDDQKEMRRREYDAINQIVEKLEASAISGNNTSLNDALDMMETLWTVFLDDLAQSDNGLSEELRARLISIGIWIIKRSATLRLSGDHDVASLIEVNAAIRDGLR